MLDKILFNCLNWATKRIALFGNLFMNYYKDLINSGIALIFYQKDNCYAKFGQKSLWKVKNND